MAEPGVTLRNGSHTEITFDQLYQKDQHLRSGSYGVVFTCQHKLHPETTYAVKILDRSKLKKKDDDSVFREVAIMKELTEVKNVLRLVDFFAEPERLYMVLVYAAGGDVFDRLTKRTHYNEKDARDLAETLLETIHAMHIRSIVHRDLKPENLLLLSAADDSNILLADFGFARRIQDGEKCTTRCGTPAYVAPEVIIGTPYSLPCDLWSIGCLLFMIIGGYPPFQGDNHRELFRKVRAADFVFHEVYWKNVSVEAKRVISNLLAVNPEYRWNAETALQSDWFIKADTNSLRSTDLSGSLAEMRKFRARSAWKSTFQAVRFAAMAPFWNADATSFTQQLATWDREESEREDGDGIEKMSLDSPTKSPPSLRKKLMGAVPRIRFDDVYKLGHKLRKGSYATVWECFHRNTQEVFAVKIITRKGLEPKDDEAVLNEVSMMQSLVGNKYVVQLFDFYEEPDYFFIVMQHMAGGDVFDRIVKMSRYTEKDARDLVIVLLKAVNSMHALGIAHRDIKPQNLLLVNSDDHSEIKVGDFGFARRVHTPESLTSRVGTPSYVAPEVLKNVPHDTRVDLWSVGVVTFVLLVGYPPFMEDDQSSLFHKIRTGEWTFNATDWKDISEDAKDFIRGLLVVDPKERWTVEKCLRSPWLRHDPDQLSQINLSNSALLIKEKRNRLRTFARAIMWMGKGLKPTEPVTQAQRSVSDDSCEFGDVVV